MFLGSLIFMLVHVCFPLGALVEGSLGDQFPELLVPPSVLLLCHCATLSPTSKASLGSLDPLTNWFLWESLHQYHPSAP